MYTFDQVLDRSALSTMKWEAEIDREKKSDLLCFGTADMDFRSAEPILQAIRRVADIGHLGYPYIRESFYVAIEAWLERTTGWRIDAHNSIAHNVSIYTAVWNVLDAFTKPNDEIIIQTPVHFCFNEMITKNDRITVMNPLKIIDGKYTMDFEQLERCFSVRTKAFWLCNPHNPVGRAWSREELEQLAEICIRHEVLIISDDVYCGLLYPGTSYIPIASLSKEVAQRTITCYSPSKMYNTTGIKYAFVVTQSERIMDGYKKSLHRLDLDYGINTMGLAVTEAALSNCDDWLQGLMSYVQQNYNTLAQAILHDMPRFKIMPAESTYFAWLDFRGTGFNEEAMESFFRKKCGMVVEYGCHLGTGGEGFVRLNLACPLILLEQAIGRMTESYRRHFSE